MPSSSASLDEFSSHTFTYEGTTKTVFERGEGPGVVVMTEVPGITPAVLRFATCLVDAGFYVALPNLFGDPGRRPGLRYSLKTIGKACISREFSVLQRGGSSPVIDWCRALARDLHARRGGPGVGAIGMCLTGNFALTMMLDSCMVAPVLSQPSLPFALGAARRAEVHADPNQLSEIAKTARREDRKLMALRFTHDFMCPRARFDALRDTFGSQAELIEIDSGPGNPHKNPRWAHSVLTEHLVDERGHPTHEARAAVIAFLQARLGVNTDSR